MEIMGRGNPKFQSRMYPIFGRCMRKTYTEISLVRIPTVMDVGWHVPYVSVHLLSFILVYVVIRVFRHLECCCSWGYFAWVCYIHMWIISVLFILILLFIPKFRGRVCRWGCVFGKNCLYPVKFTKLALRSHHSLQQQPSTVAFVPNEPDPNPFC